MSLRVTYFDEAFRRVLSWSEFGCVKVLVEFAFQLVVFVNEIEKSIFLKKRIEIDSEKM